MSPTIRISEDTYEHLQEEATPFTDTPDSVIRRLLGLDTADADVVPAGDDAQPVTGYSSHPVRSVREAPGPRAAAANGSGRGSKRPTSGARSKRSSRDAPGKRGPRAPRGSLLREEVYEMPILTALAERGGRAGKNEVLDALEPILADELTELDRAEINSGEVRWRNRAQFVRLRLVERGDMVKGSPRGIWELSDKGRTRLTDADVAVNGPGAR
ncbi:hypothetical protein BH20ACT19_BH20ACT19_02080 [soil metagenome]